MMIELMVYDFDGVMTDNTVRVTEDGKEFVVCNRDDGWAVGEIRKLGNVKQLILSSESSLVVMYRAQKLGLDHLCSCQNKKENLAIFCEKEGIALQNVCYVGNGWNDIEVMKIVGFPIATADAHSAVKAIAEYETIKKGGEGAILEVYEFLFKPKTTPIVNIRLRHVGLVIEDVRASLAFYNRLGFTDCKECKEDSEFINTISNSTDVGLTTYKLTSSTGDIIELLKYDQLLPGVCKDYRMPSLFDRGVAHFALTVSDIKQVERNLIDVEGVRFLSKITMSVDGKVLVMFVVAPEGSFIELVEEIR